MKRMKDDEERAVKPVLHSGSSGHLARFHFPPCLFGY
jgi:hypothetical protein